VIHAGLTDKIIPIKMSSQTAAELFRDQNIIPDVVYVDGDHEEVAVYADISAYFPLVKGHGFICGDDWNGGDGLPIKKAVERFAQENNLLIHVTGEFWLLTEL
jgi:hypothetical protein